MAFPFSHRNTTQVLNFFARQAGGEINKLKALKLVYFADRYHLRRFGRPIRGDEYLAMPYGPVASSAKDLAEIGDFLSDEERSYGAQFLAPVDRFSFRSTAEVSDDRALNFKTTSYEPSWLYEGGHVFKKHYFGPKPGELREKKADGKPTEEFLCACYLDALREVKWWARNLSNKNTSFRLQTSKHWFYPDFVCLLKTAARWPWNIKANISGTTQKRNAASARCGNRAATGNASSSCRRMEIST